MKPLVVIPARAGSKGLPGKNWKILGDKPLIQYSIEVALQCFDKEQICVSTDSSEVIEIARSLGIQVPFIRPKSLASDEANSREVLLHAWNYWHENDFLTDVIVLLQPTSPFRTAAQINDALQLFSQDLDMVVGVKETRANPYYVLREEDESGLLIPSKKANFTRRQDCPKVYEINGAFYAINPKSLESMPISEFKRVIKFEMDEFSSHDIDNEFDWLVAESILKSNKL